MSNRPWYHDGFNVVVVVVGLSVFLWWLFSDRQKAEEPPAPTLLHYSGQIDQPAFDTPRLKFRLWHFHPGSIENGRVTVRVFGDLSTEPEGGHREYYSFETWAPNEDGAIEMLLPLTSFDEEQEIRIMTRLVAKNAQHEEFLAVWQGSGWKLDP